MCLVNHETYDRTGDRQNYGNNYTNNTGISRNSYHNYNRGPRQSYTDKSWRDQNHGIPRRGNYQRRSEQFNYQNEGAPFYNAIHSSTNSKSPPPLRQFRVTNKNFLIS